MAESQSNQSESKTKEPLKRCSKCRRQLSLESYSKNRALSDGLQHYCRECSNIAKRQYRASMLGREATRAYNQSESHQKILRTYRIRNRVKRAASDRVWRLANAEAVRETGRQWRRNNPDRTYEFQKRYLKQKRLNGGSHTNAEWIALCERHHGRCARCGKQTKLERDHIVPVSKGGDSFIDNIQPLCHSCNSIKGKKEDNYRKG